MHMARPVTRELSSEHATFGKGKTLRVRFQKHLGITNYFSNSPQRYAQPRARGTRCASSVAIFEPANFAASVPLTLGQTLQQRPTPGLNRESPPRDIAIAEFALVIGTRRARTIDLVHEIFESELEPSRLSPADHGSAAKPERTEKYNAASWLLRASADIGRANTRSNRIGEHHGTLRTRLSAGLASDFAACAFL
jgi:hypothetical protein